MDNLQYYRIFMDKYFQLVIGIFYFLILIYLIFKIRKVKISTSFKVWGYVSFYIMLIITFGLIYRGIATISHGEDFVFQEDIYKNMKSRMFLSKTNLPLKVGSVISLVEKKENDFQTINFYFTKDDGPYYFAEKNIGIDWAVFYRKIFMSEGITHYSLKYEDKTDTFKMPWSSPSSVVYKFKLDLYQDIVNKDKNSSTIGYDKDSPNYKLIKSYILWLGEMPEPFKLDNGIAVKYVPIDLALDKIMATSHNSIDKVPDDLHEILDIKAGYPLIDFIYFSCVTCTTLGYGDILPNSSLIRFLVIIESISGILISGAVVSLAFSSKDKISENEIFKKTNEIYLDILRLEDANNIIIKEIQQNSNIINRFINARNKKHKN